MRRFSLNRFAHLISLLACGFLLGACGVVLPALKPIAGSQPDSKNPRSISINEVVKRVKCEVWDSIKNRPEKQYPWFNKWVVQADLTLTVNDASSINPGATFSQPLTTVGTAAQTASIGLGAGLSATAFRTEIVSFSISISELRKEFEKPKLKMIIAYNDCNPYGIADLTGNLGLAEWVNSAFGPIDNGLLKEGQHPAPKAPSGTQGGAPPAPAGIKSLKAFMDNAAKLPLLPTPPADFPPTLLSSIDKIYDEYYVLLDILKFQGTAQEDLLHNAASDEYFSGLLNDFNDQITRLAKYKKELPSTVWAKIDAYSQKIKSEITPPPGKDPGKLRAIVTDSLPAITALAAQISQDLAPVIPTAQLQCDCYPGDSDHAKQGAEVLKCLNTIQSTAKLLNPAKPSTNPPIDAISHQVNFVIAVNASANPLWTLVRFKGPSPSSGNFASLSESSTHNLTLVMGIPGSAATQNARSALTLSSALATQLAPQLGFTPSIVP